VPGAGQGLCALRGLQGWQRMASPGAEDKKHN